MNPCDISDEEFVPFLHSLGVETYKKSFEWMLNDPAFAGVLRWLYNNLDHNNALTDREEYRYLEIEKSKDLPPNELEASLTSILKEYPGVCLPVDQEAIEDVKLDIKMQRERLDLLDRQLNIVDNLLKQNESTREQLNLDVTKLHGAQQQGTEDEAAAAQDCLQLVQEVETLTEGVIDVIADTLDVYSNCNVDKDLSKKFFTFGPYEAYRQSQALYRSHFDLYTSKKFSKGQKDGVKDEDLRSALIEAKSMEDRLRAAALRYIESKAALSGEQAKLALVANYNNVHASQVTTYVMEARSALELLEQEESILEQQITSGVKDFVSTRSRLTAETAARAALAAREQIHTDISHLLDTTQQALVLDRLLYCALRYELRTLEELVQFMAQLRLYVIGEEDAVRNRIESMNDICAEQEICEQRLQSSDTLIDTLCSILGKPVTNDVKLLAKYYSELQCNLRELKDELDDRFRKKEAAIVEFVKLTSPLREYIWDGCTRQPNSCHRTVARLTHSQRHEMDVVDRRVADDSGLFTAVKNGDKNFMRKLWQWFLTDPNKLVAAVRGVNARNYS